MTGSEHRARCQTMRGGVTESEVAIIADLEAAEKERDALKKGKQFGHAEAVIRMEAAEKQVALDLGTIDREVVAGMRWKDRAEAAEKREAALVEALNALDKDFAMVHYTHPHLGWSEETARLVKAALAASKEVEQPDVSKAISPSPAPEELRERVAQMIQAWTACPMCTCPAALLPKCQIPSRPQFPR